MISFIVKVIIVLFLWNLGLLIVESGYNTIKTTHAKDDHLNLTVMWGYTTTLLMMILILGGWWLIDTINWGAV